MSGPTNRRKTGDDMKARYDFSKGKRTTHAQRYRRGHAVRIHRADGSVTVQHF